MGNDSSTLHDKRTLRKEHRDEFVKCIERWRQRRIQRGTEMLQYYGDLLSEPNDSKVTTILRVRPIFESEEADNEFNVVQYIPPLKDIVVNRCNMHADLRRLNVQRDYFHCDHVFLAQHDNNKVYTQIRPFVTNAFNSGMSTVFCFGQTGSGKTYTTKAIAVRAACDFFELAKITKQPNTVVRFSSFEIQGSKINDLQQPGKADVKVLEDENKETHVHNISVTTCESAADLTNQVKKAFANRKTAATIHAASSRSHAVLCFQVGENEESSGKLLLLDLAGSERKKDSKNHSTARMKEAKHIQTSVLALKKCCRAMRNKSEHIPFRESKLTQVLKSSFVDSKAKVAVIATVSPCSGDAEHSCATLKVINQMNKKLPQSIDESAKRDMEDYIWEPEQKKGKHKIQA